MCSKVGMMEGSWEVWLWLHCWWLQVLLSFSLNFSFLLWLHAFQHHTSLHSRAFSDSLKFLICGLTSKSFGINSPYESLKFAEKFSLSGLPFLITRALHIHLLAACFKLSHYCTKDFPFLTATFNFFLEEADFCSSWSSGTCISSLFWSNASTSHSKDCIFSIYLSLSPLLRSDHIQTH